MAREILLAIDIGNTNITMGIFRGERLVKKAKLATVRNDRYTAGLKAFLRASACDPSPCDVVISSVVPSALSKFRKALAKICPCRICVLGEDAVVSIKNLYSKPKEVGQDRLVNAFAARELYGTPAVVIDFGTAITFDCVSKKGEYLGGLILPGIRLSLDALYERTALLPKVALRPTRDIIGKATNHSMRAGVLFGFGAACDGLVKEYKKLLGRKLKVIATGGDSPLLKKYSRSIQTVDPDLTLKGIALLSQ
jgi:type III pantothenate kinase